MDSGPVRNPAIKPRSTKMDPQFQRSSFR